MQQQQEQEEPTGGAGIGSGYRQQMQPIGSSGSGTQHKEFTPEERKTIGSLLQKKLGNEHLATRLGSGGAQFTYVEGWQAIQIANSIFGFNGWSSSVLELTADFIEERPGKFIVGFTALVRITLKDGTYHEDVGYGLAENSRKGIAIENSKKEAVTDARKRALRLFGNALGNCVYDKGHIKRLKTSHYSGNTEGLLPVDTNVELMQKASNNPTSAANSNANNSIKSEQAVQYTSTIQEPQKLQIVTNNQNAPSSVKIIVKPNVNKPM